MATPNKFFIKRAGDAITSSVTIATAGKMNPTQARFFVDSMIDQSQVLKDVDTIQMPAESYDIDSMAVGTRLLRMPGEATEPADIFTITTAKRTMVAKEVILPWDTSKAFIEDNLERGGEDHVIRLFGGQFGNDLADLAFNGDGATPGFLACNVGWVKLAKDAADTNKYDTAASTDYLNVVFPGMVDLLPAKYQPFLNAPGASGFKLWVPTAWAKAYKRQLQAKIGSLADQMTIQGGFVPYEGIDVVPQGFLTGAAMLVRPKNLKVGIHRDVSLDILWDGRTRLYKNTMDGRVDFEFAMADEIVIAWDVTP